MVPGSQLFAAVVVDRSRFRPEIGAAVNPAAEIVPGQPPLKDIDVAQVEPAVEVNDAPLIVLRQGAASLDVNLGRGEPPTLKPAGALEELLEIGRERLGAHGHAQPWDVVLERWVARRAEEGAVQDRDRPKTGGDLSGKGRGAKAQDHQQQDGR